MVDVPIVCLGKRIGFFDSDTKVFVSGRRFFREHVFHKVFPFSLGCSVDILLGLQRRGCKRMVFTVVRDDKPCVNGRFEEEKWVASVKLFLEHGGFWKNGMDAQRVLHVSWFDKIVGGVFVKSRKKELACCQKSFVERDVVVGGLTVVRQQKYDSVRKVLSYGDGLIVKRLKNARKRRVEVYNEGRKDCLVQEKLMDVL